MGMQDTEILFDDKIFRRIVENTFEATVVHSDYKVLYVNETAARMIGAPKEALVGVDVLGVFPEKSKEMITERVRKAQEENQQGDLIEQKIITLSGEVVETELFCQPFDLKGKPAVLSVFRDISSRKEQERELRKRINEVSTPLVPVMDGISVLPLIGQIDFEKAKFLLETLPEKVKSDTDVKQIIIDFSGIYNIDEIVVDFLIKIDSIMKLMGICPLITGIRPELAQKGMNIGMDMSSIKTMASVRQAIGFLTK